MAGRFEHLITRAPSSWAYRWRAVRAGLLLPYKPDPQEVDLIPRVAAATPPEPPAGHASVTWVGHATFLVQTGGLRILTDPVWSDRVAGHIRRMQPPGLAWEDLPPIDAVVLSHNHYDHMDHRTLDRLPKDTHMLVPLGDGPRLEKRGFTNVHALGWWASTRIGGVEFQFVPAHHWSRRRMMDTNDSLWGGWVVTAPGTGGIYFAGDSAYGECFAAIARRHPRLDVALLPIGAYTPRWHEHGVHMDPYEAVEAFDDLGARVMVPMHWGTFPMSPEPVLEPRAHLLAAWAEAGLEKDRLADLPIGGTHAWRAIPEEPAMRPPRPARRRRLLDGPRRLLRRVLARLVPTAT